MSPLGGSPGADMSIRVRFSETRLEREDNRLRLVDGGGAVLLELRGPEIDDAIRAGFVDPDNLHYSMFEYSRMRVLLPSTPNRRAIDGYDADFLKGLKVSWN
jgi:hypothetical protein